MIAPDIQKALFLIDQGNRSQAEQLLRRWIQDFPVYPTPYVLLARLLEQEERWQEALSVYHIARFLVPGSPTVIRGIQRLVRKMRQGGTPMQVDSATREATPPTSTTPSIEKKSTSENSEAEVQESPLAPLASFPESAMDDSSTASDAATEAFDLDTLIQQLDGARIVPQPDFEPEQDVSPFDEAMADDVVSETLAMILEAQKQYEQAAQVYERLSQQHPERAEEFLQKAVQMRLRKSGKSRDK